jgi:hypothetical protein
MEDDLVIANPERELRKKFRAIFTDEAIAVNQAVEMAPPAVTDPNANPFSDVPLPAGFREAPLPPVTRQTG